MQAILQTPMEHSIVGRIRLRPPRLIIRGRPNEAAFAPVNHGLGLCDGYSGGSAMHVPTDDTRQGTS